MAKGRTSISNATLAIFVEQFGLGMRDLMDLVEVEIA